MAQQVVVNLSLTAEDYISGYGSGAKLYLDSSSSEAGTYTNAVSTVLVSGTEQYELWDPNGTSATWYQARAGKANPTSSGDYSDYSEPFRATSQTAYASLEDLLETMDLGSGAGSSKRLNLLADLLVDATEFITDQCHRSFFRNPQVSGTDTFTFDVINPYATTLSGAVGYGVDILSIDTLRYRESSTDSYTAIAAGTTGYLLRSTLSGLGSGAPYDVLTLSADSATRATFPTGAASIELVGALGFESIPRLVKRATVDLARQWYRQGAGAPQQLGVNQFGTPIFEKGLPDTVLQLLRPGSRYVALTPGAWV